jgi:hypothetical protein
MLSLRDYDALGGWVKTSAQWIVTLFFLDEAKHTAYILRSN